MQEPAPLAKALEDGLLPVSSFQVVECHENSRQDKSMKPQDGGKNAAKEDCKSKLLDNNHNDAYSIKQCKVSISNTTAEH